MNTLLIRTFHVKLTGIQTLSQNLADIKIIVSWANLITPQHQIFMDEQMNIDA